MEKLEKLVFIYMTGLQYTKPAENHPDFLNIYAELSDAEKDQYTKYHTEVHAIWSYINSPKFVKEAVGNSVNTLEDYHSNVKAISPEILQLAQDYNITLRWEIEKDLLEKARKLLGDDFADWLDE